jgi:2,3-bisphosphoglycerate-independent phosphoglycerate mutase
MRKKILLMILDGWGTSPDPKVSAIEKANTPFTDAVSKSFPFSRLKTDGLAVGLPEGQMGNSEVGHMNIGAGRVVYQNLVRINLAVQNRSLNENAVLINAFNYAKTTQKKVHFIGLVSDGGVHSHLEHLIALCKIAEENGIKNAFIHAFTDGRDTDPQSGLGFMKTLSESIKKLSAKVASVTGRYYAMDRDKRWERVALAYNALVKGEGKAAENYLESIQQSYEEGITDEFIKPIVVYRDGKPLALVEEGDVVIAFNFRTDRLRELTQVLTQEDFPDFGMKKMPLHYVTMTAYDKNFQGVSVIFEDQNLDNTLGEVLAKNGKKQIRIAETEKYPHVTFFFSGGREEPFAGEKRLMCPSPKVATYDLKPEMSAFDIRDRIIPEIRKAEADFICLNFANPDMVGHTGVFDAVVKACETVDACAKDVAEAALSAGYAVIITADHGNADNMLNPDGSPNTAHSLNLVPCYFLDKETKNIALKDGKLADLAPTILEYLGIEKPENMTGESLFVHRR